MTTWQLTTLHNKSAETHTFMSKGKHRICIIEGFQTGSIFLETDTHTTPTIDLNNPSGINTYTIPDAEWELDSFDNSWFSEIKIVKGVMSEKKLAALQELFDDDNICGLEDNGWEDEGECEWWFHGPLALTPLPPPGYTTQELDQDNPYNQWMHETKPS